MHVNRRGRWNILDTNQIHKIGVAMKQVIQLSLP